MTLLSSSYTFKAPPLLSMRFDTITSFYTFRYHSQLDTWSLFFIHSLRSVILSDRLSSPIGCSLDQSISNLTSNRSDYSQCSLVHCTLSIFDFFFSFLPSFDF
ncbi:uncharacterized protein MELLADRAFT_89534 [Melampsora larici-populina 98AG31]|uniref:Uncharacterized protein n=1 Tax=Melampsora larici-populina (strain 98AG31 / pathotype 3-4-7) TaxID=747676 RepID=F4SE95_MELLP|nr:uncharacterized protein MELLADRAFT_89534 [Melampsora larici-populina 98AG31]EGF97030.1 hypothetical protein MELLADRAFT_89534 [Melampsora larici-populina 98AG31]